VTALLLTAPQEELVRTDNAQLATFALSMVGYMDLVAARPRPRYLLGHSLGEFSALVASGLLTVEDGARLIAIRGRAMARAAQASEGSMVAVMGGDDAEREPLFNIPGAWVANVNGTGQIVMSGTPEGLAIVVERHRDWGWKRATSLPVGGAFHSPLMASAQAELDAALAMVHWGETEHRLIANVDGLEHTDAVTWQALLSQQLTSSVQFLDATLALPETVTRSIEMPPGAVLTGLTKRIRPFVTQLSPASAQEMKEVVL
jgi:[acyl-carrier-protein] S-malonyltransferase